MEPTLDIQPISRANLTVAERELFASYVAHNSIASHQREAEQGRIASFARLLAAYSELDTYLAEAQGEFEELSRALEAATSRATKAESRAEGLQAELAEQEAERLREIEIARVGHVSGWNVKPLYEAARVLKQCRRKDLASVVMFEMSCHSSALHTISEAKRVAPTPPPSSPAAAGPGEAVVKLTAVIVESETPGVFIGFLKEIRGVVAQESSRSACLHYLRDVADDFIPTYKANELKAVAEQQGIQADQPAFKVEYSAAESLAYSRKMQEVRGKAAAPTTTGEGKEGVQS